MSRWHTSRGHKATPWLRRGEVSREGQREAEGDAAGQGQAEARAEGGGGFCRRGYHHGNLKEALIEAARQLTAERGPHGFTLVEAARLAGVSPSAPYRHYRDREALMAELARRGFALFAARLEAAASVGGVNEALAAMGRAYLGFAREQPGYYGAMFGWRDPGAAGDETSADSPFGALVTAIARLLPEGRQPEQARLLALEVWALSHGLAGLERAGMPPKGAGAPPPEAVLADAVTRLLRVP